MNSLILFSMTPSASCDVFPAVLSGSFKKFSLEWLLINPSSWGSFHKTFPLPAMAPTLKQAPHRMVERYASASKTAFFDAPATASFQTPMPIGAGIATKDATSMAIWVTLSQLTIKS